VVFRWGSLVQFYLFIYINDVLKDIKYSRFHIYADDLEIYHSSSISDLQRCYDEINIDLQQIHEWATANGLNLNPEKSQVILIHRCRADIPPPTLLIGANVDKVVPTVRNFEFVLNERLATTDHFRKVCQSIYWILRSLRPHAAHTSFEVRRRLVLSLIFPHVNYNNIVFTGADSGFKACLRYIHMRRRLDHVSHLESTVTGTLLVDNARIQLLSFLYMRDCMFAILLICFLCFILPIGAH
jgi:hypothetical protein